PPPPAQQASPAKPDPGGDARQRLIDALQAMDRPFVVDNLEMSSVAESPLELTIAAPKEACTMLGVVARELREAAKRACGRARGINPIEGAAAAPAAASAQTRRPDTDEELRQRAMSDPAGKSFRDAFPDAEVRQVPNLTE